MLKDGCKFFQNHTPQVEPSGWNTEFNSEPQGAYSPYGPTGNGKYRRIQKSTTGSTVETMSQTSTPTYQNTDMFLANSAYVRKSGSTVIATFKTAQQAIDFSAVVKLYQKVVDDYAPGDPILKSKILFSHVPISSIGSIYLPQNSSSVYFRIDPAFGMDGAAGNPSQFGMDYELLDSLPELKNVKITSIHTHIQSQNLGWETLARYYANVFALAAELKERGFALRIINFGSGCGIVYDETSQTPLDMEALGDAVRKLTEQYAGIADELIIEPGRYLVGKAGIFRTRIIDKKVSRGKTYLIASGGMNGFLRPAAANIAKLYGPVNRGAEPLISCERPCGITVLNDASETEEVTITGNLCSGFDVFARDIVLPKAEVGDYIEFSNAGSYACTLSLREFASQPKVREFFRTVSGEVLE